MSEYLKDPDFDKKFFSKPNPEKIRNNTKPEKETYVADLISTVSTALTLTTRLREIGKNLENKEFKSLVTDLSLDLADAKFKIANLISENAKMKEKLHALTSATGELCPKCKNRTLELIASRAHPTFGEMGFKEREYKCSGCGFTESLMIEW